MNLTFPSLGTARILLLSLAVTSLGTWACGDDPQVSLTQGSDTTAGVEDGVQAGDVVDTVEDASSVTDGGQNLDAAVEDTAVKDASANDVPPDDTTPCSADDEDCDGLQDADDNCPKSVNPDQLDTDADGDGDACDYDDDDDGVFDEDDAFPLDPDEWSDVDGDGVGDNADTETCDGIDNDGDGVADNGLEQKEFLPDNDGDGFGVAPDTSCASLLASGQTEDGIYTIAPEGPDGLLLQVFCDMTTDGGGWTRVFFHDVAEGYFSSKEDAALKNVDTPDAGQYSILSHLGLFRSSNGTFELRINWPGTDIVGRNMWRQSSNPTTSPVSGYDEIQADYNSFFWGGLELSDAPSTFVDGSVNHPYWFYSIGSNVAWGEPPGIPAHGPSSPRVALWVRPDTAGSGPPLSACAPPPGYAEKSGDCNDSEETTYPGAPELCNALDDNCDGDVDPDCPFGDVEVTSAPQPLHFYAREVAGNQCTFSVEGTALGAAEEVQISVDRDGFFYSEETLQGPSFATKVVIEGGLYRYDVTVSWDNGTGFWKPTKVFKNILCGDAYLIDGQSNAVASDYHNEQLGDAEKNTFVRSYGSSINNGNVTNSTSFNLAGAQAAYGEGSIGQWGLRMANRIKEEQSMPILIINGAVGGTAVIQHQRNNAQPNDTSTIYGRLLWRAQMANVAESVRGIFWHQGESDANMAYNAYLELWTSMYNGWLEDYPNVEAIYTFQVRNGCGSPTWNRNVHRDLPNLLEMVKGHMSTTGVAGHDTCHFYHAAYAEWGERMARLVNRDLYGTSYGSNIEAPDPVSASFLNANTLGIEFGDTGTSLTLEPGAEAYFSLSDGSVISQVQVVNSSVVLTLAGPSNAQTISFVEPAGDVPWLVNDLGIGSFAWYDLPIFP